MPHIPPRPQGDAPTRETQAYPPAVDHVHEHVLMGYSRGTEGDSRGTQGVLRGTQAYPPAVGHVYEHVLTGYSRGTQGVLKGYPPAVDHVHEHVRVAQVVEESVAAPAPLPPPQAQDVVAML